ncbi:hypothetical protein [Thalassoroseus pseudoceratinae]|uniref:hypothetical protein n=1 Tax=Thalassoroseus pseudoceratinae TaxID=2713176 RepID=UPI00142273EE|nr:hypothetical protein [Thalassoroseus pseudoceratinae]
MIWPKYWDENEADLLLVHANRGTEAWHDATDEFPMKPPSSGKRLWLIHSNVPENSPSLMCSMEWYTVDEVREFIRPHIEQDYWEIERDELSRCVPQQEEVE